MASNEAVIKNGKPTSVAELREAIERLGEERDRFLAQLADAEAGIKECTRAVFDGDGEALEKRKGHRMKRNMARDALEQISLIWPDLQRELDAAITVEEQAARERDAEQAKEFADGLARLFGEVDDHLVLFHQAYFACFNAVRVARARGWVVPSEELMQSKMDRALRTAFSVAELRGLDLPPLPFGERCSFASIGAAYAQGLRPRPPLPQPTPQPRPQQAAAKSQDFKMPPKGDLSVRMPGDDPSFTVRIPARP